MTAQPDSWVEIPAGATCYSHACRTCGAAVVIADPHVLDPVDFREEYSDELGRTVKLGREHACPNGE